MGYVRVTETPPKGFAVGVVLTRETGEALMAKAVALGISAPQLVAQMITEQVCSPEDKDWQRSQCMELNRML